MKTWVLPTSVIGPPPDTRADGCADAHGDKIQKALSNSVAVDHFHVNTRNPFVRFVTSAAGNYRDEG